MQRVNRVKREAMGETIRKLRKELRYTQKDFGALLKVSGMTVSNCELGIRFPSGDMLISLAKIAKANKVKIKFIE